MRPLSVFFVVALFMTTVAFGQLTLHDTDFSPIGYSYRWGMADGATFDVGNPGANQTWDFGNYPWLMTQQRTFEDPTAGPHGSDFPTATRVEHIVPDTEGELENYSYQQITPTAFTVLGQASGDSVIEFNSPALQMPLPATYGSEWQSVMHYEIAMFDSFVFTFRDSLVYVTDGWGTVTTPYGSWPVLRVFMHHWITTGFTGTPDTTVELIGYMWVNQQGNAVVAVTSDEGVTDPNFTTGSIAMIGVPLSGEPARNPVAQTFAVGQNFPNPFNPTTVIPITVQQTGRVRLDVFNELGQVVLHQEKLMPAGTHQLSVDGSNWGSGMYFAKVSLGMDQRVIRMNLLK